MNMPFEMGIDDGCRRFAGEPWAGKQFLILADKRYAYQKALSDIAGNDIETHAGRFDTAIKKVRNWLVSEAGAPNVGARRIIDKYSDFWEWYYEKHRAAGAADKDIKDYPTKEVLAGMAEWKAAGEPATY